jgi:hypothetical protein
MNFANIPLRVFIICDKRMCYDPTPPFYAPRSKLTGCTDVPRTTLECFVAHMQISWEFIDPGRNKHHRSGQVTSASWLQTFQAVTHNTQSLLHHLVALRMHEIHLKRKHVQVLVRSIIRSARNHSVLLRFSLWLMRTFIQCKVQPLQNTSQNILRATMLSHCHFFNIFNGFAYPSLFVSYNIWIVGTDHLIFF